ncbi:unnamed protein product, partial [marine sediment metagenome]
TEREDLKSVRVKKGRGELRLAWIKKRKKKRK